MTTSAFIKSAFTKSVFTQKRTLATGVAVLATLTLALTACSSSTQPDAETPGESAAGTVTVIVHDSFPNDDFEVAASAATGYDVRVVSAGDGGELSSQLVLTQAAPVADVFFGVDNVYASRLLEHGVTEPFTPATALPPRAAELAGDLLSTGNAGVEAAYPMVPIDLGATCINIDPAWFAERGIAEPQSYEDLAAEPYRGLTALLDPTMSSTGASFLIGTVAKFGEAGFEAYWQQLAANDPRLEQGWTEAYNGRFTQGGGDGTHPIVLSYSSSPAWTVTDDGTASTTKALLDTCSSQIEYAGVLSGAANPEGAKAVLDYMLSREFQDTIADTMYMYPVDEAAYVPEEWQSFAPLPSNPNDLRPSEIAAGLDDWLKRWSEATGW